MPGDDERPARSTTWETPSEEAGRTDKEVTWPQIARGPGCQDGRFKQERILE
jgi:hypothetical protein